ncbi:MAG TPA: ABC transporter ATP-binding protein, partial [Niabella sp.]|nr:ABC transporter ATP-binding protein [Niabella sp.]
MMNVIEITQLKKQYNGNYVLKGIDLQAGRGMILGYIGPNGAGKSTTIKIMAGIIDEFEGDVKVLGMDVRQYPVEVKRRIGYIPELAALYEVLTPVEYLKFTGKLYGLSDQVIAEKGWELLKLFDLADKAEMRMSAYSKGMRQKVLLI